ncbi:MAG: DEAD/DEAH box helicase family protein [Moorea sp. SIO1G6]|uniref:DEAD/DEAH box helicase n=1 Tax=Moorena sp. SIO1G6 TaxID=2607840 RepID=UPI0013C14D41|nr:DEAD/DEAH box helicase [Moorena sp. SIO1G6]NET65039.1 DEAD/DEAH box helicase family protein [Moorena sp. SIO1G6]
MALKKVSHSHTSAETPEALFRDIKNKQSKGLLSHQADILRKYCQPENLNLSDIALQLPTGSGKTVVGLLIGEWRRSHFNEKVVYLCPTIQLVNQVVEQSLTIFGIKANAFTGERAKYAPAIKAEYTNAETIAVTTYSGLFNTNTFFNNADIIILDDAHAAENYIAKYWSLSIDKRKHSTLFKALVSAMHDIVPDAHYSRLISTSPDLGDIQYVEKIPTPFLHEILGEITEILDIHIKDIRELQYSWSVLRDHLFSCHIYSSYNSILIRPVLPPTRTHQPFSNPKQRIYMSATLGEGGELERLAGTEEIVRLPVPDGWDQQGIGRRFFFFPERSLNEEDALNLAIDMTKETPRTLIIVPNKITADQLQTQISTTTGYQIFKTGELEKSKQHFISEEKAVAIVANRYDGIDLGGDECRLLIVKGLQKAINLQEKFLLTRMPASILFNDRVLTRIVQAVGRCTRSDNDYSAVVVLGSELNDFLLDPKKRKFLHPEIQAEIEYGNQQSKDIQASEFIDNLQIFLKHKEEWNEAEKDIIDLRDKLKQSQLPGIEKLQASVAHEVRYQNALWSGNFKQAVEECRSVLSSLSEDDVKGYRAFWYYLAGSAAWIAAQRGSASMEGLARDFFRHAASTTNGVSWLYQLSSLNLEENNENQADKLRLTCVIEGLESQFLKDGNVNTKKFEAKVKAILDNLQRVKDTPEDPKAFEKGHEKLGCLLGYKAGNSNGDADPDPWWIAHDDFCIVFEDHSTNNPGNSLGANKVRQAASHPNWVKQNISTLRKESEIIPVVITPCKSISNGAKPHTQDLCYWNQQDFQTWAENAITVVRELKRSFPGEASLEWRKRAMQAYQDNALDPASLAKKLRNHKLADLPIK